MKNLNSSFIKDLLKYIPSKIIPAAFGFITIPIFTRVFNTEEYGQYILVTTTISILSIISTDWISISLIRFYAEYLKKSALKLLYGTIIRITLVSIFIISVGAYITLYLFKSFIDPHLFYYFNIAILLLIFGGVFGVMLEMLVVKRKPNQYSFFSIWRQCVCILLGIAVLEVFGLSVDGMLWGIVLGIVIAIAFLFNLTFKGFVSREYSNILSKNMFEYGFPLIVTNLAGWVLALSDRYILEYFKGSQEVGLYSISYSLADKSIQLPISLIVLTSAPIVMNLWETKGENETAAFVQNLTRFYLMITVPAVVGLSLLSKQIVQILTTESFHEGYRIIPMVASGLFLFGFQRNFQLGLLFFKKTKLIMYILLISGLINIILNIIFVPKYGFLAAGYTTLICYAILCVLIIIISRKYFIWEFPFKTLLNVSISVSLMSILVLFILNLKFDSVVNQIIASVSLGAIFYCFLLIFFKEISNKNMKELLNLVK